MQANSTDNPVIPTVDSWIDMATLLTQELDFGFNTTSYVDANASDWCAQLGLNIPRSLPSFGQVLLSIESAGFSSGSVGLIADVFTSGKQPILLEPAQLGPDQVQGITVTLDPGFAATLTVQYWAGDGAPPAAGASLTVTAQYLIPSAAAAAAANAGLIDGVRSRYLQQALRIGPTPTAVLGAVSFIVGSP